MVANMQSYGSSPAAEFEIATFSSAEDLRRSRVSRKAAGLLVMVLAATAICAAVFSVSAGSSSESANIIDDPHSCPTWPDFCLQRENCVDKYHNGDKHGPVDATLAPEYQQDCNSYCVECVCPGDNYCQQLGDSLLGGGASNNFPIDTWTGVENGLGDDVSDEQMAARGTCSWSGSGVYKQDDAMYPACPDGYTLFGLDQGGLCCSGDCVDGQETDAGSGNTVCATANNPNEQEAPRYMERTEEGFANMSCEAWDADPAGDGMQLVSSGDMTLGNCQESCDARDGCKFFNWYEDNGCRTYTSCTDPTDDVPGVVKHIYERIGRTTCQYPDLEEFGCAVVYGLSSWTNVDFSMYMTYNGEHAGPFINMIDPASKTSARYWLRFGVNFGLYKFDGTQLSQLGVVGPRPIAHWSFDEDLTDEIGELDLQVVEGGGGYIDSEQGAMVLDGSTILHSNGNAANGPVSLGEKTMTAWVSLDTLDQSGGCAVMGIDRESKHCFDSLVFEERQADTWMAGSSYFHRTNDFPTRMQEFNAGGKIHVALVYSNNGETIKWLSDDHASGASSAGACVNGLANKEACAAHCRELDTACAGFWFYNAGGSEGRCCPKKSWTEGEYYNAANGAFYQIDPLQIELYRNGVSAGVTTRGSMINYAAGDWGVVFGTRIYMKGDGGTTNCGWGCMAAKIYEASLFDTALTADEIMTMYDAPEIAARFVPGQTYHVRLQSTYETTGWDTATTGKFCHYFAGEWDAAGATRVLTQSLGGDGDGAAGPGCHVTLTNPAASGDIVGNVLTVDEYTYTLYGETIRGSRADGFADTWTLNSGVAQRLRAYVDDELVADVSDMSITSGAVGFATYHASMQAFGVKMHAANTESPIYGQMLGAATGNGFMAVYVDGELYAEGIPANQLKELKLAEDFTTIAVSVEAPGEVSGDTDGASKCADEGGTCTCTGTAKYGAGDWWYYMPVTGSIACTTAAFALDPFPGVNKECRCMARAVPSWMELEERVATADTDWDAVTWEYDSVVGQTNFDNANGKGYTVMVWVKPTQRTTGWVRILGKGGLTAAERNYGLWIHADGDLLAQVYGISEHNAWTDGGPGAGAQCQYTFHADGEASGEYFREEDLTQAQCKANCAGGTWAGCKGFSRYIAAQGDEPNFCWWTTTAGVASDGSAGIRDPDLNSNEEYWTLDPACETRTGRVPLDTWTHLALRLDSVSLCSFIDGTVFKCSWQDDTTPYHTDDKLTYGFAPFNTAGGRIQGGAAGVAMKKGYSKYIGHSKGAKIFNQALTDSQIAIQAAGSDPDAASYQVTTFTEIGFAASLSSSSPSSLGGAVAPAAGDVRTDGSYVAGPDTWCQGGASDIISDEPNSDKTQDQCADACAAAAGCRFYLFGIDNRAEVQTRCTTLRSCTNPRAYGYGGGVAFYGGPEDTRWKCSTVAEADDEGHPWYQTAYTPKADWADAQLVDVSATAADAPSGTDYVGIQTTATDPNNSVFATGYLYCVYDKPAAAEEEADDGNFIDGGDFETPTASTSQLAYSISTDAELPPGGWTVPEGNVDWGAFQGNSQCPGECAAKGSQFMDMCGTARGSLQQTLTGLTPDSRYQLSFKINAHGNCGESTKELNVFFGDVLAETVTKERCNDWSTFVSCWSTVTITHTPAAETTVLKFQSVGDSCGCAMIDDVQFALHPED